MCVFMCVQCNITDALSQLLRKILLTMVVECCMCGNLVATRDACNALDEQAVNCTVS